MVSEESSTESVEIHGGDTLVTLTTARKHFRIVRAAEDMPRQFAFLGLPDRSNASRSGGLMNLAERIGAGPEKPRCVDRLGFSDVGS
jgi:hypothetical protein